VLDEPEPQGADAERALREHRPVEESGEAARRASRTPASLMGRFVVEFKNQRVTGMAAEEIVAALEEDPGWNPLAIYQIRYVYDDGRMELIGVEDTAFARQGGILLHRAEVKEARARYEALLAAAREKPPPCRIELQMASGDGRYTIAMLFPEICQDAVEHWARQAGVDHAAIEAAGPVARARYEESGPDVVISDAMSSGPAA
jgi:hypothetical protein